MPEMIGGGVLKLERVRVICPACGQQVDAVAADGRIKGYCTVARQLVDFPIETQGVRIRKPLTAEIRAKLSAIMKKRWQDPEYRAKQTTAEARAKLSATAKKLWQDPEYRAKQIASFTDRHITAETRAKISATLRRRHKEKGGVKSEVGV